MIPPPDTQFEAVTSGVAAMEPLNAPNVVVKTVPAAIAPLDVVKLMVKVAEAAATVLVVTIEIAVTPPNVNGTAAATYWGDPAVFIITLYVPALSGLIKSVSAVLASFMVKVFFLGSW